MIRNNKIYEEAMLLYEEQDWQALKDYLSDWEDGIGTDDFIDKVFCWLHIFMPHYFRDPSAEFHRGVVADFFSNDNEYGAYPRGFSKTTLIQGCECFTIANADAFPVRPRFEVFIEKSATEAEDVLTSIRNEFVTNELIIMVYGDLFRVEINVQSEKTVQQRDKVGDFNINGIRYKARGFEKTVRGLKDGPWRPTRIVLDDVETDEHINNPDQRKKYEQNLEKSIMGAIDITGRIKMFGTILHIDSLLSTKIRQHHGTILRAIYYPTDVEYAEMDLPEETTNNRTYKLLWPERWSYEVLQRKLEEMRSKNQSTNAFEQEYRNNPTAEEERKFKANWLWNENRRVTMEWFRSQRMLMFGFCAIDTADATTAGADFTAAVVHFFDSEGNRYRVDVRNQKVNSNGLIDMIFDIWTIWKPFGLLQIGVEKKAFEDSVAPALLEEKRKRGIYPIVTELKSRNRAKENRIIGSLQGPYEYGRIWDVGRWVQDPEDPIGRTWIAVGDTEELKNQLYDYPSAAHDDLPDAEGYIDDMKLLPPKGEERQQQSENAWDFEEPVEKTSENTNLDPFA